MRVRGEEGDLRPVDEEAEEYDAEAGEDADEDGEDEEEIFFAEVGRRHRIRRRREWARWWRGWWKPGRSSIDCVAVAGDEEVGEVEAGGRSAEWCGLLLDEEDEVQDAVGEIGFCGGAEFAELRLQREPADFEGGQVGGILGGRGGLVPVAAAQEWRRSPAVLKAVRRRRLRSASEMRRRKGSAPRTRLVVSMDCREEVSSGLRAAAFWEILLGGAVAAETESGFTGAGEGEKIFRIDLKNALVGVEGVAGIVDGGEELGSLEEVGRPGGLRLHETEDFGLRHGKGFLPGEEVDEFQAGRAAVGIGVGGPDAVNSVVEIVGARRRGKIGGRRGGRERD